MKKEDIIEAVEKAPSDFKVKCRKRMNEKDNIERK